MAEFRCRVGAFEIIFVFVFHRSGLPVAELLGEHQFNHFFGCISHRIETTDDRAGRCSRYVINRYSVFFQSFDYPDMGGTFRTATAQNQAYFLGISYL